MYYNSNISHEKNPSFIKITTLTDKNISWNKSIHALQLPTDGNSSWKTLRLVKLFLMCLQLITYPSVLACSWPVESDVLILVYFVQIHQLLAVISRSRVVLMICWENWEISWEHLSPNRPAQLILVNLHNQHNQHNRWMLEAIGQIYSLYNTLYTLHVLIYRGYFLQFNNVNDIFLKFHLEWRIWC